MIKKRIYVTPKDIKQGGVWDGHGKDAISIALRRALKAEKAYAGATLFTMKHSGQDYSVGYLPAHVTALHDKLGRTLKYDGPRFNFRVTIPEV